MNFGERTREDKASVVKTSKYEASKEYVVKLIESDKYKNVLNESDFWILKNFNKDKTECYYQGLIISHDALLKINDTLGENERFNQMFVSEPTYFEYNGTQGIYLEYRDKRDGMMEFGEISAKNLKNDYPFAMLNKRLFDRVVKRKAHLVGVYSDSEADEFAESEASKPTITDGQKDKISANHNLVAEELKAMNVRKPSDLDAISVEQASDLCKLIEERMGDE